MQKKTTKLISALLIISTIAPAVLFSKPKKAEAFWFATWLTDVSTTSTAVSTATGTGLTATQTGISIKNVAKEITRQIFMTVARRFLQEMTKSTINWINTGNWGNPLFVENPSSFFNDIAKYEVRTFVDVIGYDPLRYPFGKNIALNTIDAFKRKFEDNAQYSLSKVINDPILLRDYRNNFNVGGWNGFLINTQYPQNNYVGFKMLATEELARKLAGTSQNAAQEVNTKLQQGMGFLSPQTCPSNPNYPKATNPYNPPAFKETPYEMPQPRPDDFRTDYSSPDYTLNPFTPEYYDMVDFHRENWERTNKVNKENFNKKYNCPKGLVNTTPGSVVASQITNAMGSQFRSTELAAALGNSISAITDALLNKFIGSGLNSLATKVNPKPPVDDWSYLGNTLGSPSDSYGNAWSIGPDEVIVLNDFKQTIEDGINNTNTEVQLMDDIFQSLGQIWPKARELDICQPGPNLSWQNRMTEEMSRNSKELQGKLNDDDGKKSAKADLAFRELKFAVNFFKDWINNKMMTELPNSVLYMDAVDEIHDLAQQADELTNKKRAKTQALARLQSIQTALNDQDRFSTQPVPGSNGERVLVSLKKQYNAIASTVSNAATIDDARNELAIAKDKLSNLNEMITQCGGERIAKGWTNPGGRSSTYLDKGTEQNLFCDFPIQGGYDHESFRHANDNKNGKGVTHPEIPYVNAKDVLKWARWGGIFGNYTADINMNCDIIYKSNVLDYKGNLPGTINIVEPYVPLPDDTGDGDGDGGEDGGNGTLPNPHYSNPAGGVCASDEEITAFLQNHPGDTGRLPSVFPCN